MKHLAIAVLLAVAACSSNDSSESSETTVEATTEAESTTSSTSPPTTEAATTTVKATTTTISTSTTLPPDEFNDYVLTEEEWEISVRAVPETFGISTEGMLESMDRDVTVSLLSGACEGNNGDIGAFGLLLAETIKLLIPGDELTTAAARSVWLLAIINASTFYCLDDSGVTHIDERPSSQETEEEAASLRSGTYIVGDDIAPGLYRTTGYWALLEETQDIIDNNFIDDDEPGYALLSVPETCVPFVEISGTATPIEQIPFFDPLAEGVTQGVYLVGFDIQPGTYRVSDPDGAYAARLAVLPTGEWDILDNNFSDGNVILTVEPGDFAFEFSGVLELLE